MTHVESREAFQSTGDVVFHFGGRRFRLKTFIDEDQLFVMFLDATNGRGSYGGGRFLHAPLPKDGRTVLDFNKAFKPVLLAQSQRRVPDHASRQSLELQGHCG